MPRPAPPLLSVTLTALRRARGWTEVELARAAGISKETVSHYEREQAPSRDRLESLAAAMGYEVEAIDDVLLALAQATGLGAGAADGPRSPADPSPAELRRARQLAAAMGRVAVEVTAHHLVALLRARRAGSARRRAAGLWEVLAPLAPGERRLLVEKSREYQTWALAERLCHESAEAASDDASRAVELAELALRVAELAPGERLWRLRLQGYCLGFLANARRVRNDERGAEEAFARARRLWQEGEAADPGRLLAAWRLLDLEASLRRSQRRFAEALELSGRALAAAPREAAARILVNKAVAFDHLGEAERAIATLRQAAPLVDDQREPRLLFALRFNLATNLCHLDRHGEAALLLPEVRQMAEALHKELDLVRVVWLEGRVAAGLGRPAAALAAFARVRGEFLARAMAYDAALVTLELAALHAAAGRTAEVKELARQTARVFRAKGIHREARAALQLFRQAADREALTAELARRLVAYLYRARHDPALAFAA
ncbi:MAG TPA: helix-turn-helix transcriptional regulator [Thermoanaerobaculia bacterium]|nr:helix-turn-helix transcriptional regulator [Thermoanaerobaculia bacterium]